MLTCVLVVSCVVPTLSTAKAYSLGATDGSLFNYGDAAFYGSTGNLDLNRPVVGMAATPDGKGYWLVASDGGIFSYGDAAYYGSTGGLTLNRPIVGIAASPDGKGYWLVASDGGIFNYGDAAYHGSTGGLRLNKPIVAMAATPDGKGYWLVASDGGIFSYGNAAFYGSTGGLRLNKPIVAMAATPDGKGYWLVAADGGVFTYGDAAYYGSAGGLALNRPVVAMAATPDGRGYWLVASDGGVFTYGDAGYYGSAGGATLNRPVVAMAATPDGKGYWFAASYSGMSPPAGFTPQQMIFDDQFSGTSLDTSKWNTYLGAQGIVWNNFGRIAMPYSGPNTPSNNELAMYGPSQASVNDGLTLTAQRNTNAYAGTYPWISGAITTEGKFSLPTTGWYVQAKIKVPDMTQGMWPGLWFLPAVPGPFNEIDFLQGGFTEGGGPVNQSPLGTGYFPTGQSNPVSETIPDLGFDATAGYHIYGVQWTPGVGVKGFVDGKLVWSLPNAAVPGGIVAEPYEIILDLQVASATDAAWHTFPSATSPGGSMEVAEVQAYSSS